MNSPSDNSKDWFDESDDSVAIDFMARIKPGTPEFDRLKALIDEGVADIERGDASPLDFEEIKRMGRELFEQRRREQAGS